MHEEPAGAGPVSALPPGFELGPMSSTEAGTLIDWAAAEAWNPGLSDLDVAWAADPQGFIALRRAGELCGGGSILSYGGRYGFMGLFIMRPDLRGRGLGAALWHHRLHLLRARLQPGAAIGMDGVFDMVPFYARGGFRLLYRDLRFEGEAPAWPAEGPLLELADVPRAELLAFDDAHVAAPRHRFLEGWLAAPGVRACAWHDGSAGGLRGYAVLRPCRRGFKLGPVFADDAQVAHALVAQLLRPVAGGFVQLDVPEPNAPALALARSLGWRQAFGCARMTHGPDPGLPVTRIFGVTSFEFG